MIVDFDDVFNNNDAGQQVPQEILELINQDLPSNFCCYRDSENGIVVGPRLEELGQEIILNVEYGQLDDELKNILKDIPKEYWLEYFYRTQRRIPVKNMRIGNGEKQIPIEQTMHNPLADPVEISECYMYPEPFPAPIPITIKTVEGNEVILNIKRQPCESMDEIMLSNIDFPALKMVVIINEKENKKSKIKYSVTPTKAKRVSDAIAALNVFKGLYNGTASINGKKQTASITTDNQFDNEQIETALDLWITLKQLEDILGVTFDPAADFPHEDIVFLSELRVGLLERKGIRWNHPFEHFHVNGLNIKSYSIGDILGKEKVSMNFFEGPISATLLGAIFELYSETEMRDFIITSVEWDDESKTSGEIYIADEASGKSWVLIRKYLTAGEAEKRKRKIELKDNAEKNKNSTE